MKGVYQHCGEQHPHRDLAEFDFRYNNRIAVGINDTVRAENALKGIVGKRLTYRRLDEAKVSQAVGAQVSPLAEMKRCLGGFRIFFAGGQITRNARAL
jgi:hypothetical protein